MRQINLFSDKPNWWLYFENIVLLKASIEELMVIEGENYLVSVVIPTFNDARFIAEAIDSVLAQNYPNLEIIIIDDGSTDRTPEIVRSYNNKVRLFEQPNQGAAVARNRGISEANGFYIAFLDADDFWEKGKIKAQVRALRASGLKMAYSSFIVWEPDINGNFPMAHRQFERLPHARQSSGVIKTGWIYAELLLDCIVWTSTVIVETAELRRSGLFDAHFRKGQDYALWLRLAKQLPMLGMEAPTALYRMNQASITHRLSDECFEYTVLSSALDRWGENAPEQKKQTRSPALRKRLHRMLFNHGMAHYSHGNIDIAVTSFSQSLERHGFQIKTLQYLIFGHVKRLACRWHLVFSSTR